MSESGIAAGAMSHRDWLQAAIEAEPYWFHKIDLGSGLVTPGWSEPAVEKLPYFLLPEDLSGMRVLDIGCAEGYFSFESKRRTESGKESMPITSAAPRRSDSKEK